MCVWRGDECVCGGRGGLSVCVSVCGGVGHEQKGGGRVCICTTLVLNHCDHSLVLPAPQKA